MDNTFVGYVNELRLNHAANLSNFNRAFKMYFGKTPSTYRKG